LQKEKELQHSQVMNRVGQISTSCIFGAASGSGGVGGSGYLGNLDGRNSYNFTTIIENSRNLAINPTINPAINPARNSTINPTINSANQTRNLNQNSSHNPSRNPSQNTSLPNLPHNPLHLSSQIMSSSSQIFSQIPSQQHSSQQPSNIYLPQPPQQIQQLQQPLPNSLINTNNNTIARPRSYDTEGSGKRDSNTDIKDLLDEVAALTNPDN